MEYCNIDKFVELILVTISFPLHILSHLKIELFLVFVYMLLMDFGKAKHITSDGCNTVKYFQDLKHHLHSAKFNKLFKGVRSFGNGRQTSKSSIFTIKHINYQSLWKLAELKVKIEIIKYRLGLYVAKYQ